MVWDDLSGYSLSLSLSLFRCSSFGRIISYKAFCFDKLRVTRRPGSLPFLFCFHLHLFEAPPPKKEKVLRPQEEVSLLDPSVACGAQENSPPTTAEALSPAGMFDHVRTQAIHSSAQCSTVRGGTEGFILKMAVFGMSLQTSPVRPCLHSLPLSLSFHLCGLRMNMKANHLSRLFFTRLSWEKARRSATKTLLKGRKPISSRRSPFPWKFSQLPVNQAFLEILLPELLFTDLPHYFHIFLCVCMCDIHYWSV